MASISVKTAPDAAPVPFAAGLEEFADKPALLTATGAVSYRELARRADEIGERLSRRSSQRRLVLLAATNDVDTVAGYLAALRHGHPVLLAPRDPGPLDAILDRYEPDVILHGTEIDERHPTSAHTLHPDLALLLSTSGSTGSPKLVRLSRQNVQSNAEAIATYLDIRPDDRAATTLPLYYCYGLSVLHSHLHRGAAVILTDLSVADSAFWELFRREGGTTFAGVPYTFDLLDRVGFADLDLPHLRYVTQAGGRLAPERVRHYAQLGRSRGWDLFVMYGQTEATARMAYLPPDLAEVAPDAIGIPIPGGSFRIAADDELVYSGPNVMLGYAEHPADLGLGRTIDELHTGDLARQGDDGLYRITGRRNRFLKLYGLRLDLQRVESRLAGHGVTAYCAGDDHTLVVAIEEVAGPTPDPVTVRRRAAEVTGLPSSAIDVHLLAQLPRLPSGKPDYPAIAALARPGAVRAGQAAASGVATAAASGSGPGAAASDRSAAGPGPSGALVDELVRLYATVLDRSDVTPEHSFVDLGGDSLSYVETSIRIEQLLGTLPPDWHATRIADLAAHRAAVDGPDGAAPPPRRRLRKTETSVLLRALAIVLVVGTHIQLFVLPGGAHMLLGVAGFNFARFQLTAAPRAERVRSVARSVGRIVAASVAWIALVLLFTDHYSLANLFLVNRIVGTDELRHTWHFWFIEDLLYVTIVATALLSIGAVDRWQRRWPFAFPVALTAIGLVARYQLVPGVELPPTLANAWLFTIGWAVAKAAGPTSRAILSAATVATVPGFFGDPAREAVVIGGVLLLIWVPAIPAPRLVGVIAGGLASASLYIYLVHWQVYPHLWHISPLLALVVSLVAGLAYAAIFTRLRSWLAPANIRAVWRRRSATAYQTP